MTASAGAYESTDPGMLDLIPRDCEVVRVPTLDTARHLSIAGRYPGFLAVPDRWASWSWAGSWAATRAARRHGARAVWSTYPIATAHLIGAEVSRRTGLPWIADFRDPMVQQGYPQDPARWRAYQRIERSAARHAAAMVFVTPGARRMYRERFADVPAERFALIENGYDEAAFAAAAVPVNAVPVNAVPAAAVPVDAAPGDAAPGDAGTPERAGAIGRAAAIGRDRPLVLLHSGIVYPDERDPTNLVRAVANLHRDRSIRPGQLVFRFRAPVHAQLIEQLALQMEVAGYFECLPAVPYEEALREMMACDGLLAMQAANCNEQIPAKVYEYLRAGRPVLALTDPTGDTGALLRGLGCPYVAALESEADVTTCLARYLRELGDASASVVRGEDARRYSRRALTGKFAQLLDEICATDKRR